QKRTASLDWEDVRFFAALARHATLAGTARALKVTHATVARRLANFEATLGQALFTRGAHGFSLNAAGATALAEAAQMEMAACALLEKREPASSVAGAAGAPALSRGSSGARVRRRFVRE
ncbi:MAG TPA: LysR family transcriptional regulator, partial [Steroidobacteraceae bacterium]|nr:LysR family transcriptional regulator [Steroidobacteraceae bacterium]